MKPSFERLEDYELLSVNVVLIVTDDMRADQAQHMPFLNSTFGVVYENAVVSTPACCPSRAQILSGNYSFETGVRDNYGALNFDPGTSIAVALDDAGYKTVMVGKYLNGYNSRKRGVPLGWDRFSQITGRPGGDFSQEWYGILHQGTIQVYPDGYQTDELAKVASNIIKNSAGQPFFVYWAPTAPHLEGPPALRHRDMQFPVPPQVEAPGKWLKQVRMLQAVDEGIERIYNAVASIGQLSNTVFMFVSDNGLEFGEHGATATKYRPYEESIHVPLMMTGPAATQSRLVANIDIAPTIAELVGVPFDATGESLLSVPEREAVYVDYWSDATAGQGLPGWRGVRGTNYVYVEWRTGLVEYYDLTLDPAQGTNLFGDLDYSAAILHAQQLLAGF